MPGFHIAYEIARGGMGVVYAARDPALDRDVAVKVMHPGLDAEQFVVESKVTAQLLHPGIPPVYAIGTSSDGRPFLAMKLIRGRTLVEELRSADRATDLPRLLDAFEQICQTVGVAHASGIVHRDLKPANIMVGPFGEVQVMDWGLATQVRHEKWELASGDTGNGGAPETVAGALKGTPAYMAPEQARGEPVDARADVFALGGILAFLLTGEPPFVGDSVPDTIKRAAVGDLEKHFERLDGCGADTELIAIAKRCLARASADRFADGRAVADAVATHRAGAEERLRTAERERAVSAAEVREQRKRRTVQRLLIGAVLVLVCGGAGVAWWRNEQANERRRIEAAEKLRLEEAQDGIRTNLKLSADLRKQYKFKEASAALVQALKLAESVPGVRAEVERAQSDLAFVVKLDDIRFRNYCGVIESDTIMSLVHLQRTPLSLPASQEYREAFTQYGLDLITIAPAEAAKRIAVSAVKADAVAAVDDWALRERDIEIRNRLLSIARLADPGEWTDRLRSPTVWSDKTAVAELANTADFRAVAPATLSTLVELMQRHGSDATSLLMKARAAHPTNFDLAFALGVYQFKDGTRPTDPDSGPLEAALALRPESAAVWCMLGIVLHAKGDKDRAIAALRKATQLAPKFTLAHLTLGAVLQ
ncbi:MAG: protein kinase, partial [Planctomycetes bacterium]|nr:protein kinase [Planctomycetota bacterium]